ncbi:MAG: DUF29 family protein [Alphaproteobacteria bacterium]|jgi:hypothetical protein|nr:DUF29 family protein [Alphaproteobacteria bacterium]
MSVRYDDDFFTWTQEQAAFLKARRYDQLDIENLADEVESMGKSEIREFASRVALICAHLLKLEYQTERTDKHERSWQSTVRTQRRQLRRHLEANPGLKNPAITGRALDTGWNDGRDLAVRETEIDPDVFPDDCPYSFDQIAGDDFWPPRA